MTVKNFFFYLAFLSITGLSCLLTAQTDDVTAKLEIERAAKECALCHLQWMGVEVLSFDAAPEKAAVSEEMCYSCHDGTVLDSRGVTWTNHQHPTNVVPSDKVTLPADYPLTDEGKMYCGTCHIPHNVSGKPGAGQGFLRERNQNSEMCRLCHPQWDKSAKASNHPLDRTTIPIPQTVIAAGGKGGGKPNQVICQTCHLVHSSPKEATKLLVIPLDKTESHATPLCEQCHGANPSRVNRGLGMDSHPVNVAPSQATIPQSWSREEKPYLSPDGKIVCRSCHRAHFGEPDTSILVEDNVFGRLCKKCHPAQNNSGLKELNRGSHPIDVPLKDKKPQPPVVAEEGMVTCNTCHRVHDAADNSGIDQKDGKMLVRSNYLSALCEECHKKKMVASLEEAEAKGTHPVRIKPNAQIATITQELKNRGANTGVNGEIICQSCHRIHRGVPGTPNLVVANVDAALCKQCHRNYSGTVDNLRVITNHPTDVMPQSGSSLGLFKEAGGQLSRQGEIICTTCHRPHAAVQQSKLQIVDVKGDEFCRLCHVKKKTILSTEHNLKLLNLEVPNVMKQTPQTAGVCSACHLMHQGKGPRMWARDLPEENPTLSSLCLSCHQDQAVGEKKQPGKHSHKVNLKPWENTRVAAVLPLYNDQTARSKEGKVFCQTCHDPHQWDPFQPEGPGKNTEGTASNSFLRLPNDTNSSLCTSCHRDHFPQNSEHDLAVTAPEEKNILGQEVGEAGVCSACHLVHNAQGIKLWARELSGAGDVFTQLCSSCHAADKIAAKKQVGEHSHPVDVKMFATQNPLELPLFRPDGQKDPQGKVSCATCHNTHQWDPDLPTGGPGKNLEGNMSNSFLRISNQRRDSPLCRSCHDDRYPEDTAHDMQVISPLELNIQEKTTLETGICSACHLPHNGTSIRMWARSIDVETGDPVSRLCVSCHSEKGLAHTKIPEPYSHPLGVSFTRQKEQPGLPLYDKEGKRSDSGRVSCASCHNPHQWDSAKKAGGTGLLVEGDLNNSFLRRPNQQSQLCKACHLDRRIKDTDHDLRVTAPAAKNKKGFTVAQTGVCSACHLPHGGNKLRMWARDRVGEGNLIAQLCRSCHSDGRIAAKKQTGIIFHPIDVLITNPDLKLKLPLFDRDGAYTKDKGEMACATCHNAHRWDATKEDYGAGENIEGNGNNSFLRIRNDLNASLCSECHPEKAVVVGTDHDMSITAPKEKNILGFTAEESGSCSACHLVHNALDVKLWGRVLGKSDDLNNALCLSCHAPGQSAGKKVTGKYTHSIGAPLLEKGMTTTLPLFTKEGFVDINGLISCATCHNAHIWAADKPEKGKGKNVEGDGSNSFLRKSNQRTASLCVDCHQKQGFLIGTDHDLATTVPDEKNIKGNSATLSGACSACHLTHNGNDASRWARSMGEGIDFASRICFSCHKKDGAARTKLMGSHPHPLNVRPGERGMSTTLPLFTKEGELTIEGEIVCLTCHDIHQWSPELIAMGEEETEQYIPEEDIKPGVIGKVAFIMGNFVYIDTLESFTAQVNDIYAIYREGKLYASVKVTRTNPIAKTFEAFCEILKNDLPVNKGDLAIDQNKVRFGLGVEGTGKNSYLRRPNDGSTQICLNCHADKQNILNTDHDLVQMAPDLKNSFGVTPTESGACSACHLVHKSEQAYLLSNPLAIKRDPYSIFCSTCHNLKGPAKRKTISSHHIRQPIGERGKTSRTKKQGTSKMAIQMPGSQVPLFQETTGIAKYEGASYVTCPSCHNVHQWDPEHPANSKIEEGNDKTSFLRVVAAGNKLCRNCHLTGVEKVFNSIPLKDDQKPAKEKPKETGKEEIPPPETAEKIETDRAKAEKDITLEAPLITLPDFPEQKEYVTSHKIALKGTILDEPPITSAVLIFNGIQEDILVENGKFAIERVLNEGSNFLKIMATDEDGNTGFSPEVELIADTSPPEIINYIYPEPKIGRDFFIKIVCNEPLDVSKPPLLTLTNASGKNPIISGGQLTAQYLDKKPKEVKERESLLPAGEPDPKNPPIRDQGQRILLDKTRYYEYHTPVKITITDLSYDLNPGMGNDELKVLVTSPLEPEGEELVLTERKPGIFVGVFGFETIRIIGFDFSTKIEPNNQLIGVNDRDFFKVSYGGGQFTKTIQPNDSYMTAAILLDQEMSGELKVNVSKLFDLSGNPAGRSADKFISFHPEAKMGFHETPEIDILEGDATRVRDIHLKLTAFGATQMKLTEDEDMSGVNWMMFQSEVPFQLSEGNGSKRIYALFKNEWGFESAKVSSLINYNSLSFKKILSGTLDSDLELKGNDTPVLLQGKFIVPRGKQLKIGAGVDVLVASTASERGRMIVEGQLLIQGEPGQLVTFKSYEVTPKAGDWGGISFNIPAGVSKRENLIERVSIQQATVGITLSPTKIKILNSTFSDNLTAIFSPDNSFALIKENTFTDNLNYAIVCRYSHPELINNKITGNKIGIWCQNSASPNITNNFLTANEQGIRVENLSAPKIWGNTLVGNQDKAIYIKKFSSPPLANNIISENKGEGVYIEQASPMMYNNIIKSNRVGIYCRDFYRDFMIMQNNILDNVESNLKLDNYPQRVNAQKNWWGTMDRKMISRLIYDYEEDKKLGKVLYLPTLDYAIDMESKVISLDNIKPQIIAYIYSTPQLTAPFQLTLVANESLNQHVKPDITLITEKGKELSLDKDRGKYLQTNTGNDTYEAPPIQLSAEDGGQLTIRVEGMRDLTGNTLEPTSTESFFFETAVTAKGGNYVNQQELELLIYYENATDMRISGKKDFSDVQWIPYQSDYTFTLPEGSGRKALYVQFRHEDSTLSEIKRLKIVLDTQGPERIKEEHPIPRPDTPFFLSFVFNEPLDTEHYPEITLTAENGKELLIPQGGEFSKTTLPKDTFTTPAVLLDREMGGQIKVSFRNLKDLAGNFYQGYYYYFDYDTKAPLARDFGLRVEGKRTLITNSYEVELDLREVLDAVEMMISHQPNFAAAEWQPYKPFYPLSILPPEGKKTVYLKFKDVVGNATAPITFVFTVDTTPPTIADFRYPEPAKVHKPFSITLVFNDSMDMSYPPRISLLSTGEKNPAVLPNGVFSTSNFSQDTYTTPPITLTEEMAGGITIKVEGAQDAAGNTMQLSTEETFNLDIIPPVFEQLDVEPKVTNQRKVTLFLSATGADRAIISEDPSFPGSDRVSYQLMVSTIDPFSLDIMAEKLEEIQLEAIGPDRNNLMDKLRSLPGIFLELEDEDLVKRAQEIFDDYDAASQINKNEGDWRLFSERLSYEFSEGDGEKTIYVNIRDAADNRPPHPLSVKVEYDTAKPQVNQFQYPKTIRLEEPFTITMKMDKQMNPSLKPSIIFSSTNGESQRIPATGTFSTVEKPYDLYTSQEIILSRILGGEGLSFTVRGMQDYLGNPLAPPKPQIITFDTHTIFGIGIAFEEWRYTNSRNLNLILGSPEAKYRMLSEKSDFSEAKWEPLEANPRFYITQPDGHITLYAKFKTVEGKESAVVKATTLLDTTRPRIIGIRHPQPKIGDAFRLSFQFSESLNPKKFPVIILRSTGKKDPIVPLEGHFKTTVQPQDTYVTPKITLDRFMLGRIMIIVKGAEDIHQNEMNISMENFFNFEVDWLSLAPVVVKEGEYVNKLDITLILSPYQTSDWVKVSESPQFPNYEPDPKRPDGSITETEWSLFAKEFPYKLWRNPEKPDKKGKISLADAFRKKYGKQVIVEGERTILVLFRSEVAEVAGGQITRKIVVSEQPFAAKVVLDITPPQIKSYRFPSPQMDKPFQVSLVFNESLSSKQEPQLAITTGRGEKYSFPAGGLFQTTEKPNDTYLSVPLTIETLIKGLPQLEVKGARDFAGNEMAVASGMKPSGISVIEGGFCARRNISLYLNLEEVTALQLSENPTFEKVTWQDWKETLPFLLSEGNGEKTIYLRSKSTSGEISEPEQVKVMLDTDKPKMVSYDFSLPLEANQAFPVRLYFDEALNPGFLPKVVFQGGGQKKEISQPGRFATTRQTNDTYITPPVILAETMRQNVYMTVSGARDWANNQMEARSSLKPTFLKVAEGELTNDPDINLFTDISDAKFTYMIASEKADFAGSEWSIFEEKHLFKLSSDNGEKTIYVKYKDDQGNTTSPVMVKIVLDTQPPQVFFYDFPTPRLGSPFKVLAVFNEPLDPTKEPRLIIHSTRVDPKLEQKGSFITTNAANDTYVSATLIPKFENGGDWEIRIADVYDLAGNKLTEKETLMQPTTLETITSFAASVFLEEGDYIKSPKVNLVLSAKGAVKMMLSEDTNFYGANWEDYTERKEYEFKISSAEKFAIERGYSLSEEALRKTIYVKYQDEVGQMSKPQQITTTFDLVKPTMVTSTLVKPDDLSVVYSQPQIGAPFSIVVNFSETLNNRKRPRIILTAESGPQLRIPASGYFLITRKPKDTYLTPPITLNRSFGGRIQLLISEAEDLAGNVMEPQTQIFTMDTTPPVISSFAVKEGLRVNTSHIHLLIKGEDIDAIRVSEDPFGKGEWLPFAEEVPFILSPGAGKKFIYLLAKDAAGNIAPGSSISVNQTLSLSISELQGELKKSLTLTKDKSPYLVRGHLVIPKDITLTLEAGAKVFLAPLKAGEKTIERGKITVNGRLICQGEEANPVILTTAVVEPGVEYWEGITFTNFNDKEQSELDYTVVQYATEGIYCRSSSPRLNNCQLTDNLDYAIKATQFSSPRIGKTLISGSKKSGVFSDRSTPYVKDSYFTNNEVGLISQNNYGSSKPILENCLFENNRVNFDGPVEEIPGEGLAPIAPLLTTTLKLPTSMDALASEAPPVSPAKITGEEAALAKEPAAEEELPALEEPVIIAADAVAKAPVVKEEPAAALPPATEETPEAVTTAPPLTAPPMDIAPVPEKVEAVAAPPLDTTPPQLTSFRVKEGSEVKKRDITLLVKAKDAAAMRFSEHATFAKSAWQPFAKRVPFTLPEEEGEYTLRLQLQDEAGNQTEIFSLAVTYHIPDITSPKVVKAIAPRPAEGATTVPVTVVYSETMDIQVRPRLLLKDKRRQIKIKDGDWRKTNQDNDTYVSKPVELKNNLEGQLSIKITGAVDLAGNRQASFSQDLFLFDITPPRLISFKAKEGKKVNNRDITLLVKAKDAAAMRFSEHATFAKSAWQPFAKKAPFTLPEEEGEYTLRLQLQDEAGNQTEIFSLPIAYHIPDTTLPTVKTVKVNGAAAKGGDFTLSLVFSEPLKTQVQPRAFLFIGQEKHEVPKDGRFRQTNSVNDTYVTSVLRIKEQTQGEVSLAISLAQDTAGNVMKPYLHRLFTFDLSPPTLISFKAAEGEVTQKRTIHLEIDAEDAYQMRFAETPDLSAVKWQPYQNKFEFTLSEKPEQKTVYLQLQDKARNQTEVVSYDITYELPPPADQVPPQLKNLKIIGRADRGKPFRLSLEFNESLDPRGTPKFIFTNKIKHEITRSGGGKFQKTTHDNDTYVSGSLTLDNRLEPQVYLEISGFKDVAGNIMLPEEKKMFAFDITPPRLVSFFCKEGATVEKRLITLNITADDAKTMRLSEDKSFSDADWRKLTKQTKFTLSPQSGTKTIYLQLADASDNLSGLYTLNLRYLQPLPKNHLQGSIKGERRLTAQLSPYLVHGLLVVEKEATLTILPGTVLQFIPPDKSAHSAPKSGILVLGTLKAEGTKSRLISFTSSQETDKQPGDWNGILLTNKKSSSSIIKYSRIEYATNGLTCFASSPTISNCIITQNKQAGIEVNNLASPLVVQSEIFGNEIGVDSKRAYPRLEECYIHDNRIGLRARKSYHNKLPQLRNVRIENNAEEDISGQVETIKAPPSPPVAPQPTVIRKQPTVRKTSAAKVLPTAGKSPPSKKKPTFKKPPVVKRKPLAKKTSVDKKPPAEEKPAVAKKTPPAPAPVRIKVSRPPPEKAPTVPPPAAKVTPKLPALTVINLEYQPPQALQEFTVKLYFSQSLDIQAPPQVTLTDKNDSLTIFSRGKFEKRQEQNDVYVVSLKVLNPKLAGPLTLRIKNAKDINGTMMTNYKSMPIPLLQPRPKLLEFTLTEGETITMPLVHLKIKAQGATQMMLSENPYFDNAIWRPYTEEPIYEITPDDGPKSIYLKLRSKAGEESKVNRIDTFLELFSGKRITGEITEDTTLKAADSPYLIKGSLHVPKGRSLTIEANTVIKFVSLTVNGLVIQEGELIIQGRLLARGAKEQPVVFTSGYPQPKPDDWEGIRFNNTAPEEYSLLEFCVIEYANNGITASTSAPLISHSQIRFNQGYGVMLLNFSEARLFNNVISNNKKAGVYCNKSGPTLASNSFSENEVGIVAENLYTSYPKVYQNNFTNNRHGDVFGQFTTSITPPTLYPNIMPTTPTKARTIKQTSQKVALGKTILRGSVNTSLTLEPDKGPYLIMGRYVVSKKSTLTIQAGVKLIFVSLKEDNTEESGALIIAGQLIAKGTRYKPIIFTSAPDAAAAGSWKGIQFTNDDRSMISVLEYATIENASTGIFIKMAAAEIGNSTIRNNKNGIFCSNYSTSRIYQNKITDNLFYGILARQTSAEISGNVITGNDIGLKQPLTQPKPLLENNEIINNLSQDILSE